jgi:Uma2 family endonuclease
LLTAGELADLPDRLDGQSVKYELYDGELHIMAPPGGEHSRRQHLIARVFLVAEDLGLGVAFSEVGVVLQRNPDTVLGPDAAFVLKESLPVQYTREGYLVKVPEIVVEVQSKNESMPEMRAKRDAYFTAGAKEVWWVHSARKTMTIATAEGRETKLQADDIITSDLLPGVAVPMAKLFA